MGVPMPPMLAAKATAMLWLAAAFVTVTILLSTFMSNTAASNLLLPIGISAAFALGGAGLVLPLLLRLPAQFLTS
jgi:di/tricarboxylate transporter